MTVKLTISVSEEVYKGLYAKIGAGKISGFIDRLVRQNILEDDLAAAYQEAATDSGSEKQAHEWSEGLMGDVADEAW